MASPSPDSRPLSPHLQVWRWHPTMAASIFHRASGVINYGWVAALAIWLAYAAWGGDADFGALFAGGDWVAALAYLLVLGALLSTAYHLLNGLRYLVWDSGHGFKPSLASAWSWFNLIGGIIVGGAAFVWFYSATGGF